uniref:Uncharacterized protein n=1 Tax=Oryza punctata TaxID=4537 RepID=A0A0E0KMZ6_ORYPU
MANLNTSHLATWADSAETRNPTRPGKNMMGPTAAPWPWPDQWRRWRCSSATARGCSGERWRRQEEIEATPVAQHGSPGQQGCGARAHWTWERRERSGTAAQQGFTGGSDAVRKAATTAARHQAATVACGGRRGGVGTRWGGGSFGEKRRTAVQMATWGETKMEPPSAGGEASKEINI